MRATQTQLIKTHIIMKKHIITIAGTLGSGKSSTSDGVAESLEYGRFSSGDFMRAVAVQRNMSLMELSKEAETDKTIDEAIDAEVRKAGEKEHIVIDSRLAYHWIPESFKVYLELSPDIAKTRILNDLKNNSLRRESENSLTEEEIYEKIITRRESEKKRYMEMYGLDYTDPKNFDLIVDTNKHNLAEVIQIIKRAYLNWLR